MESTPIIHANDIAFQKYIGPVEIGEDYYEIVRIRLHNGDRYLVAGSACNTGLISEYARAWDRGYESLDEALQEFVSDLEDPDSASGELLAWHGSLVI